MDDGVAAQGRRDDDRCGQRLDSKVDDQRYMISRRIQIRGGKQRLERWTMSRRYAHSLRRNNMRMGIATYLSHGFGNYAHTDKFGKAT